MIIQQHLIRKVVSNLLDGVLDLANPGSSVLVGLVEESGTKRRRETIASDLEPAPVDEA